MKRAGFRPKVLKGMKDVGPSEFFKRGHIQKVARETSALYGYREVATPVLEEAEVFRRTLGSDTDVISKEMFEFVDKGGKRVALRPEGTAGLSRMVASGHEALLRSLPQRLFYCGPMFRYESPQKGRQRQFLQCGVECYGETSALADAEVIAMALQFTTSLSLSAPPKLLINSLGDEEDRSRYEAALLAFLRERAASLSPDSRQRLASESVLRVLDSKSAEDREVLQGAPKIHDTLSVDSQQRFTEVLSALEDYGLCYTVDPHLVRGLDYYCHTIFELVTDAIGAQNAVVAGGRYDRLVQALGGPPVPAVGWAAGIDRLQLLLDSSRVPPPAPSCTIVPILPREDPTSTPTSTSLLPSPAAAANDVQIMRQCAATAQHLREAGVCVHLRFVPRPPGKQLRAALDANSTALVFIGDEECAQGSFRLKDVATGEETVLRTRADLLLAIQPLLSPSLSTATDYPRDHTKRREGTSPEELNAQS